MRLLLSVFAFFLLSVSTVFAQSEFAIRVFGGTDADAPSTPTLISATAIATNQIDVVWSASTDNFLVSGYVVFQDGVAIATTTLTSYSDLGLTASTTYTYFVKAFDPSYNYSSSSNILDATTFSTPPPDEVDAPGSGGGTVTKVVLDELRITPGVSTSTFFIKTAHPARFELRWGRTDDYELGYIVHDHFISTYETTLTDLEPSTVYEYEIIGYTAFGKATVLKRGQFSTLGFNDIYPPANVNRFTASAVGNDVRLSWQLPFDESLQYVRVVRSHLGYPTYLQDGAVVYQGSAEQYTDKGILSQYSPVYYTAFVVDAAGNVSSGAIARAYAAGQSGSGDTPVTPGGSTVGGGSGAPAPDVVASTSPTLPAGTRMPDLSEIFLIQENRTNSFASQDVILNSVASFVLSIPRDAVSENMKTIIVTVTDPTNSKQSSSFLLRLNKDKTAYEAVVSALNLEGMSRIVVDIYDYSSAVVGTFEKTVMFKNLTPTRAEPVLKGMFWGDILLVATLAIIPILLTMLVFLLYRRRNLKR